MKKRLKRSLGVLATALTLISQVMPTYANETQPVPVANTAPLIVHVEGKGKVVLNDGLNEFTVTKEKDFVGEYEENQTIHIEATADEGHVLTNAAVNNNVFPSFYEGKSWTHDFLTSASRSKLDFNFDVDQSSASSETTTTITNETRSARVARDGDAGGPGGDSGHNNGENYANGTVTWVVYDDNADALGSAGTVEAPNVEAVASTIRNRMGVALESDFGLQWAPPYTDKGVIASSLAQAIQTCQNNYYAMFGTLEGFKPRIVAVGVAHTTNYNRHGVTNPKIWGPYNAIVDAYWNQAWATATNGLTLYHANQAYNANSAFHNTNRSLTNFAVNDLAGKSSIRVIVLDDSQPFPAKGNLQISKSSALPDITDGNDCYGPMEGAQYGLYTDANATNQIGTFTIGADGNSNVIEDLDIATYYIKELKAPKHYALDPTIYSIEVQSGQTVRKDLKDIPQNDPLVWFLGKVDKNTNLNKPQGSASLENAEFTVKYYDYLSNDGEGGEPVDPETLGLQPTRTWVLKTLENGKSAFEDGKGNSLKVAGDEYYLDSRGKPTVPLGTITIEETKAPQGYKLPNEKEIFVREVTPNGILEGVDTYNEPVIKEEIHHAKFTLVKFITDADASEVVKPEVGAEFVAVLQKYYDEANGDMAAALELAKANGTDMEYAVLKTDERGEAVSNDLAFGTYVVKQTSVGKNGTESWELDDTFKVVVSQDGNETVSYGELQDGRRIDQSFDKMVHFYVNNIPFTSGLKIVKQDADSGKNVSLNSAAFKIKKVDADGQPVANYSKKTIKTDENGFVSVKVGSVWYNTFITNAKNQLSVASGYQAADGEDKGSVTVPLSLPAGDYLLSETNVPKGYLNGEDVAFKITKSNITGTDADNQPLVTAVMKNKSPKGEIKLKKTFEDPNNRLGGKVSFKLVADTDVIDPADGSIIYHAGDVIGTYDLGDDDTITVSNLPMGLGDGVSYSFVETETYGNYKLDETPQQVTFTKNDDVTEVYSKNVSFKNELLKIKTEAITETNNHKALASKKVKFVDKVTYEGLIIGKEYTVAGKLMNKETGEPLLVDGKEITGETTFTAEKSNGSVDVVFELDSSALASQTVVVFEDLYRDGIKVATHSDIKDKDQSVKFVNFQIKVNKVDSITKKNIISKEFEFTMYSDKDLKEVVKTLSGNTEDGTATFEVTEGVWYIKETKAPQGYKLSDEVVKVEVKDNKLYVNDREVSANDDYLYSVMYQNVKTPSKVRTGTNTHFIQWIGLLSLSGLVSILLTRKIRKQMK